jgi:hypothetical protein
MPLVQYLQLELLDLPEVVLDLVVPTYLDKLGTWHCRLQFKFLAYPTFQDKLMHPNTQAGKLALPFTIKIFNLSNISR